jgi:hypothetical protein
MKSFLGYIAKKIVESTPRSKKVGPTIKSVKPNLKKTVLQTKSDEYVKRIRELDSAEKKIKSGKEMIKEGQKARKNMIDTKKAFQFKHGKSTHAIKPGEKPEVKYKGNVKEQKAEGGRIGRRFGGDIMKRKTNVQKIKETFGPKKKVPNKFKGFSKLPENVQQKINAKLAKKV